MVDAAAKYRQEKEAAAAKGGSGSEEDPLAINGLIVVAGVNFGRGAPRDWATKGPLSLGVRVVLAVSFDPMYRCEIGHPCVCKTIPNTVLLNFRLFQGQPR